jgi:hypothetical protein
MSAHFVTSINHLARRTCSSWEQLVACSRSASASRRTMNRRVIQSTACDPGTSEAVLERYPSCRLHLDWLQDPARAGPGFHGATPAQESPPARPRFDPTTTARSRSSRLPTSRRIPAVVTIRRSRGRAARMGFWIRAIGWSVVAGSTVKTNKPAWVPFLPGSWGGLGALFGALKGRATRKYEVVYSPSWSLDSTIGSPPIG